MLLPRHGFVFGVFLLARAARIRPRRGIAEWVEAARSPRSFLAAEVDLTRPVEALLRLRLAWSTDDGIAVDPRLLRFSDSADRATMEGVARLLLASDPPLWLTIAVTTSEVAREYIPDEDLTALRWLEPRLDDVLRGARADLAEAAHEPLRKAIGDAAELFVLAALRRTGAQVLHVARISDRYGYDIEVREPVVRRIEVKAAGATTRGTFHLTRNEFDKSRLHTDEWRLLQVVFTGSALIADRLDSSHVAGVFELTHDALSSLVPPDSPTFAWNESALITAPPEAWRPAQLEIDPTFTAPGFRDISSYSPFVQLRSPQEG